MKRIVFLCALAAVLAASFVSAGAADKQVTLSGHPSPHTIPTYVALRKGWFEEQGLDVELLIYISGPPQMEGCGDRTRTILR